MFKALLLWLSVTLLLTGCAQPIRKGMPVGAEGKVISNYTFTGVFHQIHISKRPAKILVCGENAADTLIALGQGDAIHTLVLTEPMERQSYRKMLPKADVYPASLSQEAVLTLHPDFILAMRRFFDHKVLGDVNFWESNGIPAYIQDASGPIPSLGNFPPCTVESEIQFLKNMGSVFQQEEKVDCLVRDIQASFEVDPSVRQGKPKVLVVEFMPNVIEAFGRSLLSGDIVTKLGGEILTYKAPFISMEELLMADADVVFIVYHGGEDEKQNALGKINRTAFQGMSAVRNHRIYAIPYNRMVATGIHTKETILFFKQGMYPKKK